MSDDDFEAGSFPAAQFAFFTPEGGQWVFRGDTVADVHAAINELLTLVDESEGPGILSDIQLLKAAGVLKEGSNPAQNKGGGSAPAAGGSGGYPDWVLSEATRIAGRTVEASEIKTGTLKSGPRVGQPWYKIGDEWINKPRG
jgi:hypothetical protein